MEGVRFSIEEEAEIEEIERKKREFKKKKNKAFSVIAGIVFFIFAISIYLFLVSLFSNKESGAKEIEEKGALLYTLNIANPLNALEGIFSNNLLIIAAILIAIIFALALITVLYLNINKIKKLNSLKTNQEIDSADKTKVESGQDREGYSYYNKKVLELLKEGNKLIDRGEIANARIIYPKIKAEYDSHNDRNKKIYFEIIKFYRRIVERR